MTVYEESVRLMVTVARHEAQRYRQNVADAAHNVSEALRRAQRIAEGGSPAGYSSGVLKGYAAELDVSIGKLAVALDNLKHVEELATQTGVSLDGLVVPGESRTS